MQNNIKIIPRRVTSAIGGGSGNIGTHDHKLK